MDLILKALLPFPHAYSEMDWILQKPSLPFLAFKKAEQLQREVRGRKKQVDKLAAGMPGKVKLKWIWYNWESYTEGGVVVVVKKV